MSPDVAKNENVQQLRPPSLFVGLPTYDGKIEYKTVRGLLQLAMFCAKKGVQFGVDVVPGDAFITKARSTIAHRFMNSGFDELLYIDADVGFDLDACKALLSSDADIVAGLYRVKEDRMKFPSMMCEPIVRHEKDSRLVKMEYVAGGYMRVRRKVFEKMEEMFPDDWYTESTEEFKIFDHFPAGRFGNRFVGEDIGFCQKAKKAGFDIWAVQGIKLVHTGAKGFESEWRIDVLTAKEMHVPIPAHQRTA